MYSLLLRLLIFLSAFWLFRRVLLFFSRGSTNKAGAAFGKERTKPSNDTVKDPICGMYMDPRLAIRVENEDGLLYFCSEECRQRYLSSRA